MRTYDHGALEKKWQERWHRDAIYKTPDDTEREKCYILDMFPYPSGEGLHIGHPKGYVATDVYARNRRMNGKNVLHPMGWDAFGLPAENYAIKNKMHPQVAVRKNIKRFKEQLARIGFDHDWEREVDTTDPEYYRWTQWIFLQLYKKGLAYESHEPINWCPSCLTGLANEDLEGNTCERCGTLIEKKPMRQWVLRITEYADRLLADLETLPWQESVKEMQRNWIGRSEGAEFDFPITGTDEVIRVFTTRPDTLFGATYVVLAPEHPSVDRLRTAIQNLAEVERYRTEAAQKTEIERTAGTKEKTGVLLEGVQATNPANGESLPVFIADYVLSTYGTGAIMAVPAHDERDNAFAKAFGVPIRTVIQGEGAEEDMVYTGAGTLVNSGPFDGMQSEEAKAAITKHAHGTQVVRYRLQDWVFSRQRYWGEPIPLIHCETCGVVPVPEADLPVRLPNVESYEPTGTGESPLAGIDEWVNTTCPGCGGKGMRETNTMPQWAGSSWYYVRCMVPKNDTALVDAKKEKYWSPVDIYVGGMEHATRHLIYARFWHKFLYDIGVVYTMEPFTKLYTVGLVLAEDGRKMSKRWGNVINPDDMVDKVGADAFRVYMMFMGPFEQATAWSIDHMAGARRFLERVYGLSERVAADAESDALLRSRTIRKVGDDILAFNFNTAISALMIMVNELEKRASVAREDMETLLLLLAPFAPHLTDELWESLGHKESIHCATWPAYDTTVLEQAEITIVVQVNGKTRGSFTTAQGVLKEELISLAKEVPSVIPHLQGKTVRREVVVPGRLINFVVS